MRELQACRDARRRFGKATGKQHVSTAAFMPLVFIAALIVLRPRRGEY